MPTRDAPTEDREPNMATEQQIQLAIDSLDWIQSCPTCGMRYCVGDYECPHCGTDIDDNLRAWAEVLVDMLLTDKD